MPYCPRSSLSAAALAWLVDRLAHLRPRPPGAGGRTPLPLEVRVDAVAAVVLDGLSYRRAGRMVGISKTEVGDSMDLLLGELAMLGVCQPDGTFITVARRLVPAAACRQVLAGRSPPQATATAKVRNPRSVVGGPYGDEGIAPALLAVEDPLVAFLAFGGQTGPTAPAASSSLFGGISRIEPYGGLPCPGCSRCAARGAS
jgi:hypothetical protein